MAKINCLILINYIKRELILILPIAYEDNFANAYNGIKTFAEATVFLNNRANYKNRKIPEINTK